MDQSVDQPTSDIAASSTADSAAGASDDRATVIRLLGAAQLAVSESEFTRFVRVYPVLRAQADGLYSAEFADEDVALGFNPALGFS